MSFRYTFSWFQKCDKCGISYVIVLWSEWQIALESYYKNFWMEEQVQIIQLSELSKEDMLREFLQLLNHNDIKKLTLMVKKTPLLTNSKKQEFSYTMEQTGITVSQTRQKSSTIDRYYRSSNFNLGNLGNKSMSLFPEEEEHSETYSIMPNSPKDLGFKLYKEGEYQQAVQILEQLREEFPRQNQETVFLKEYRQIVTFLANCYYRLKEYPKAIEAYKQVLKDPDSSEAKGLGQLYNNLGCCYAKIGCQKLSMNAYSQAIKIYTNLRDIDSSLLMANIANIYSNCQMYAVAQKHYLMAISERKAKSPKNKEMIDHIYRQLSLSQQKLKKYTQALDSLDRAIELAQQGHGNIVDILFQRAKLKEKIEKYDQAMQDYEKLHFLYDRQGLNQGTIYQKAAKIHQYRGKKTQCSKYLMLALQQYKKQNNDRKVSELSSHRYLKSVISS